MTITRTRQIAGRTCENSSCPRIDATSQPGTLAVQGPRVPWWSRLRMRSGRGEGILLVPASVLDEAAAARGWHRP